jgi:hypothetical protein
VASALYPPQSTTNILGISSIALIISFKKHIWGERLRLFCRNDYVEMIKCLTIKTHIFCRLSTGILILSVDGCLCSGWRIETCLWRSMHGWRLR